jgi:phospholipid/cholesterol/gamma-HCH transport system substrate-binding protein
MEADISPQRELRRPVLWFVLTALVLLAALIGAVAWKQGLFTKTTQLYFFAKSAYGMNNGMAVKFSGFRIGTVEEVTLEPNGSVKARMAVDNTYIRFVPQDSTAHLTKEGLIGASVIEIVPGETGGRQVANNGVLIFERARDVNDIGADLMAKVQPILEDVKKITAFVNDPDSDLRQTIRNVNKTSAALVETTEEIRRLVQNSDQRVGAVSGQVGVLLGKAAERLDQVGASLEQANASLKAIDEKVPGLVLKADKTLENFQAASTNIKKITEDSAEQLPGIMRDGKAVAEDTREIIGGAKKSWPIRAFVPPQKETLIPLDSHETGSAPRR